MMGVNYLAQISIIKQFVSYFEQQGRGHIVSVVSATSYQAGVGMTSYGASKHALRGFLDGFAAELVYRRSPVTLSVFHPGAFDSKLFQGYNLWFSPAVSCEHMAQMLVEDALERRLQVSIYPRSLMVFPFIGPLLSLFSLSAAIPINPLENWKGAEHAAKSVKA